MQKEKFYVTTPIYYGNGLPHVGHFYSSIIANTLYKYAKISGKKARFTTGIDENSQKAVIKAEEQGVPIMEYLDTMANEHKKVWDFFNLDYTDFIRTTEKRHHTLVQEVLTTCHKRGDIYEGEYEGMYCVGCEAFKKDDDLVILDTATNKTLPLDVKGVPEGGGIGQYVRVCPDHLKEPDKIKEKNYFFKLSKYQTWMQEFYEANPEFVVPKFRFNEVIAFVERGLEDFSISRETNTFGIPLPFDPSQVTYVWFDALFNYYTSCKYSPHPQPLSQGARGVEIDGKMFYDESDVWPADVHIVGKDIIRFHAIYWPAMLASYFGLGEEREGVLHYVETDREKLPATILTGGYFTVDGQKMSKSLGNVIEPVSYATEYSKELLTLYMLSAIPIGNDGDYDRKSAIETYNAKLANNLGNLVNRVVVLSLKLPSPHPSPLPLGEGIDGILMDNRAIIDGEKINNWLGDVYYTEVDTFVSHYDLKGALDISFYTLDKINKYTDENEPWKLIKTDEEKTREVLYTIAEGLRQVGMCLYPFFPEKMSEMFHKLGLTDYETRLENGELHTLRSETPVFEIKEKGEPLFMRIEVEK